MLVFSTTAEPEVAESKGGSLRLWSGSMARVFRRATPGPPARIVRGRRVSSSNVSHAPARTPARHFCSAMISEAPRTERCPDPKSRRFVSTSLGHPASQSSIAASGNRTHAGSECASSTERRKPPSPLRSASRPRFAGARRTGRRACAIVSLSRSRIPKHLSPSGARRREPRQARI